MLTGDWGGARSYLTGAGVDLAGGYTSEVRPILAGARVSRSGTSTSGAWAPLLICRNCSRGTVRTFR
jgi:carbohydrate-selective porin OprB